jgi:hypothetical protein
MNGNDDDVVAFRPVHYPQDAPTEFVDCLVGSGAVRVARIVPRSIRCAYRCLDPGKGNVPLIDRFPRVFGEPDHASLIGTLEGDIASRRKEMDGAAWPSACFTLAARFRRLGAIYRNHGSDRDSPLEVNIGPGVSAT